VSLPAAADEPRNLASRQVGDPWRDLLLHVQHARKRIPPIQERNTDLQSVRPAELHSAEPAANRQLCL
jgi:hypothetical protein